MNPEREGNKPPTTASKDHGDDKQRWLEPTHTLARPNRTLRSRVLALSVSAGLLLAPITAIDVLAAEPEPGFVFPCDQPRPTTSNLNFTTGQTIANSTVATLDNDGTSGIFIDDLTIIDV